MNICVFDTETTSLEKPFCYNIGYLIIDIDTSTTLARRSYVVEQVWHNLPLFETAYYANKRPLYVSARPRICCPDTNLNLNLYNPAATFLPYRR